MTIQCLKCKKPAVTFIRYNGTHLCKNHFIEYFDKRIKKELKKQGKTSEGSKLGIAVSGGKDSIVTLGPFVSRFRRSTFRSCHSG